MRFKFTILYIIIATLLAGCKDDSMATGSNVLEEEESIIVRLDTFDLKSSLQTVDSLVSMPDSFLLGEIENKYGDLKAEIITQLACPIGYDYPEGTKMDSVCLTIVYTSWVGDGKAPLAIRAYELDKKTLNYNATYYADQFKLENYCSPESQQIELFDNPPVILPNSPDSLVEGVYMVRYRMTNEFANKFFSIREFSSQEAFCQAFKGLYITPVFGSSNILNISMLSVTVHFHFERNYTDPYGVEHKDTIYDSKGFYANDEVQQVNRFTVPNKEETLQNLAEEDSLNFIIAPAGIYTQIQFPMQHMKSVIESRLNGKRAYVNKAQLKVKVIFDATKAESQKTRDDWGYPAANMLLLRDTLVNNSRYFEDKTILLTTDDAILSEIQTGKNNDGSTYYYYSFDMSHLLTDKLRDATEPDTLRMTLVPVEVEYTTTSSSSSYYSVSAIRQAQTVSTTVIHSANNPKTPLRLEVVYSGF